MFRNCKMQEEYEEARANLIGYMEVVMRIAERLDHDPEMQAKYKEFTGKNWPGSWGQFNASAEDTTGDNVEPQK